MGDLRTNRYFINKPNEIVLLDSLEHLIIVNNSFELKWNYQDNTLDFITSERYMYTIRHVNLPISANVVTNNKKEFKLLLEKLIKYSNNDFLADIHKCL